MGVPCETVMGDGEWGWCGGEYKVMVVVGLCVHTMRGVEQVWAKKGQKPKTKLQWLGFGLQWGCRRWRRALWGYSSSSHAKLERGGGVKWLW